MTPQEIVSELDRHIVGQGGQARRGDRAAQPLAAPAGRREAARRDHAQEHPDDRPTGVGKTEIARRLARLADAPFIKVEATKFTEVGYVGRDVDTIVRDLVEVAVKQEREAADARQVARARGRRRGARARHPGRRARRSRDGFGRPNAPADSTARQIAQAPARRHAGDKEIEVEVADAKPRRWRSRPAWKNDPAHKGRSVRADGQARAEASSAS